MADRTPDELFADAQSLEADAVRADEESPAGRALRAQAAALRVAALGDRVYPVVICATCFDVTGWTSADGSCDACVRQAQLRAAYSDPHGGWVGMNDTTSVGQQTPGPPLRARLSALVGRGAAVERAWLSRVEPGETGPPAPEPGYELEVAKRQEVGAADGSGMVIRFSTRAHRFGAGDWAPLETTKIARGDMLVPGEFSAGLPIEQLAEAWADYRTAVDAFNARAWSRESQAREDARAARNERENMLSDQQHVAELLDER